MFHVRTTTNFARHRIFKVANRIYRQLFRIFIPKLPVRFQSIPRVFLIIFGKTDRQIGRDPLIHLLFYRHFFLARHFMIKVKIKPHPLGRNVRPLLTDPGVH